jgi:hypothetical protein
MRVPVVAEGAMNEIMQEDIVAMYVESTNGADGARDAFDELEKHLPGTKGRKFYGTYDPATNAYRACVALKAEDQAIDLPRWVIPGENWTERIPEIGQNFVEMSDEAGERYDPGRPSIEFYRSHDEVILLLPVK